MSDLDGYLGSNPYGGSYTLPTSTETPTRGNASEEDFGDGVAVGTNDRSNSRPKNLQDLGLSSPQATYTSYAGVDIVAQIVVPGSAPLVLGELQTISYSMHRENLPVRLIGHTNVAGFVKGPRTIAGSLIFTVFNNYAFYRLKHFQDAISHNLYPVADMLPPFDIVLTFANENGVFSKMKIYGVTIVDEGGTMSVDDLITEQTYMFMARGIQPMTGLVIGSDE